MRFLPRPQIGPLPPPKGGGKSKLKVKVRLNLHGIVSVETAQVVEEEEEGAADAKMDDADTGDVDDAKAAADKKKARCTERRTLGAGAGSAGGQGRPARLQQSLRRCAPLRGCSLGFR